MKTNAFRLAILACALAPYGAAFAGNMTLELAGLPAVQLSAFDTGVTNTIAPVGSGGGAGKASFKDFTFKATQSAATPALLKNVAEGRHIPTGRVQVRSTDGTKLLSEWTFNDVFVTALGVASGEVDPKSKTGDMFLPPETAFSLTFSRFCYRVFAADGTTVAGETCFDIAANRTV